MKVTIIDKVDLEIKSTYLHKTNPLTIAVKIYLDAKGIKYSVSDFGTLTLFNVNLIDAPFYNKLIKK